MIPTATRKILAMLLLFAMIEFVQAAPPKAIDDRLTVDLFAEHPQIVTPTGLAVDDRGRVFVAESHTHFRPDDYDGPKADRILILEDTDGDEQADKRTIFHEGFVHVMDIEFHHDGSLYVATRKDIHRLKDTNNDGRADSVDLIVRLETKGDYPHNGLSGIAFDFRGGFHFGLGENLGEPYTLIGNDGVRIEGGGEGGSTYHVDDDGKKLRRVTTGWWNPYGLCTDSFCRIFGTDNDPDSSPPCRLIQVVENGNYGYEFRYGRSGRNPLITWDGEIPGTLPMIAGTGEAPCHIVAYESDAFPAEYFGSLMIPSWADHRIEYYVPVQRKDRGLVETKRQTLIDGPDDFRPVGIDVAPDGSVYVSDWVSSSYQLHKLGRVWRIRPKQAVVRTVGDSAEQRFLARDRRIRERAARELVETPSGRSFLQKQVTAAKVPQARASAVVALTDLNPVNIFFGPTETRGPLEVDLVAALVMAVKHDWQSKEAVTPVRAASMQHRRHANPELLYELVSSSDPWVQHAAVCLLARSIEHPEIELESLTKALPELPLLLVLRRLKWKSAATKESLVERFLQSSDSAVRFTAVKWAADELMTNVRPHLDRLFDAPDLDLRTFLALSVAIERLDGKKITDRPAPEQLKAKIFDEKSSIALRRWCLRLVDSEAAKVELEPLVKLLEHPNQELRQESLRTLARHPDQRRFEILKSIAEDKDQNANLRAEAVLGLSTQGEKFSTVLVGLASEPNSAIRDEALRALIGVELTGEQRSAIETLSTKSASGGDVAEAIARILEAKSPSRPEGNNVEAWTQLIANSGDPIAGERIFFGTKIGKCSACHQVDGLGASVGPDLSQMNRRVALLGAEGERWLLETILLPSRDIAPQFTPWQIVTKDGKQHIGLPRRKGGNSEAYLGTDGREFTLKNADIDSRHEASISIMPTDLLQQLTRQELADLFAFIKASKSL